MAKYWKIILSSGHTASLSRSMHCHRHNHDHHHCFQQFFNHQIFFLFQNFSDLIIIINWTSFFSSSDSSSRKKERNKEDNLVQFLDPFYFTIASYLPTQALSCPPLPWNRFPSHSKVRKNLWEHSTQFPRIDTVVIRKKWKFTIFGRFHRFFIFILTQEIISQNKCHIISNGPHIPMTPNISAIKHLEGIYC